MVFIELYGNAYLIWQYFANHTPFRIICKVEILPYATLWFLSHAESKERTIRSTTKKFWTVFLDTVSNENKEKIIVQCPCIQRIKVSVFAYLKDLFES